MATTSVANIEMQICSIEGMLPKNGRLHHAIKTQPGQAFSAETFYYYIHFILHVSSSIGADYSTAKINSSMAVCHVF